MSALGRKVLDLAEQQGLLDGQTIADLRRQVEQSKFVVAPEVIAKVLVDQGHLTPFQARKLVAQALGPEPDPVEKKLAEKEKAKKRKTPTEELTLAEEDDAPRAAPTTPIRGWRPDPEGGSPGVGPAAKAGSPSTSDQGPLAPRVDSISKEPRTSKDKVAGEKSPAQPERPSKSIPGKEGARKRQADDDDPSTAEDFLPPPASSSARPAARGRRWKEEPGENLSETMERSPEELAGGLPGHLIPDPLPAPEDLVPIAPALPPSGADPWSSPPAPVAAPLPVDERLVPVAPTRGAMVRWLPSNVWDSPLLMVGGGALGLLVVAFALLVYALTRGTAAQLLADAEEAYRGGAYPQAIALYERFLQRYPRNPQAALARVRRGMAAIRQVAEDGQNPRLALQTARQVLPQIEQEPTFAEVRPELALILPELAATFAQRAASASQLDQKEELVALARQTLELLDNPAYLPTSLRTPREGQLAQIEDKLQLAQRGIDEEKARRQAIQAMQSEAAAGQTAAAYATHDRLVGDYPALAANREVRAALREVGRAEAQQVMVQELDRAALSDEPTPATRTIVISHRQPWATVEDASGMLPVLVEGAVYGIEASSGLVRWRRFVGYETTCQPLVEGDSGTEGCLLLDQRRREVVRLHGSSGRLVWRQPLDQTPLGMAVGGGRLLVATTPGRVLTFELASGRLVRQAQLPQRVGSAPVLAGGRLCVLGEHATLFVLDPDSLHCRQTVFLGHRPGAVLVPPCELADLVLVGESVSDEVSLLTILGPTAGGSLDVLGRPLRLKGRIVTPLAVSGMRVVVATDRGQLVVYERDASGHEPLRPVAHLETSVAAPQRVWTHLARNWVWTSADRPALFELRPAVDQLSRRWTGTQEGTCLGPLLVRGSVVVHVRRHKGVGGVQVEALQLADGKPLWTTTLAAAPLAVAGRSEVCFLLAGDGRLYAVEKSLLAAGDGSAVVTSAAATPPSGATLLQPHVAVTDEGRWWVATSQDARRVLRYDLDAPARVSVVELTATVSGPVVPWGEALAAGSSEGTVVRWRPDAAPGEQALFLPPLAVDRVPRWGQAVVLPGQTHLAVPSQTGELFVLRARAQPPDLELVAQRSLGGPIAGTWAASAVVAAAVVRRPAEDVLIGLNAEGQDAFPEIPLRGRCVWGPLIVDDAVLVASELDGLVCIEASGKLRWQQPLRYGPLVGPVLRSASGDWIGLTATGMVVRWEPQHGREQARHDVGEPLAGPAAGWNGALVAAGSDGTLHVLAPPHP